MGDNELQPRNLSAARGASTYDADVVRARALIKATKLKDAEDLSQRAIRLDDKRWEAYVTAASAYSSQGLFDDAVGMFQREQFTWKTDFDQKSNPWAVDLYSGQHHITVTDDNRSPQAIVDALNRYCPHRNR